MQECLREICLEFATIKGFFKERSAEKEKKVNELFTMFMDCFANLKEEKLSYPKEFAQDVKLYKQGFEPIVKKFSDIEIRYLMLSDFYDYVRLMKRLK